MGIKNEKLGGTDWVNGEVLYAVDLNDTFDSTIEKDLQNAYQDIENSIIDVQKDIDNTTTYTATFEYKVVDKYSDSGGLNNSVVSSTYCYCAINCNLLNATLYSWQECYANCADNSIYFSVGYHCLCREPGSACGGVTYACWNSCDFDNLASIDTIYFELKYAQRCCGRFCYRLPCINYTAENVSCSFSNKYLYKRLDASNFDIFCNGSNLCCCVPISTFNYMHCACSPTSNFLGICYTLSNLIYVSLITTQFCVNKTTTQAVDLIAIKVTDLQENYDNITFEVKDGANSLGTACADASGNAILNMCCATTTPCTFICSGDSSLNQLCGHGIKYFHC